MRALFLAAVTPDNTPHGYNWTFAFPMLLFIVSALVLWALFGRPHHRVPAQRLEPGLSSRRPGADAGGAEDDRADQPAAGDTASDAAGASE